MGGGAQVMGVLAKRIIIHGAMNHESGADITMLLATTAGIQKNAWNISKGTLITKIVPIPKTTAFTCKKSALQPEASPSYPCSSLPLSLEMHPGAVAPLAISLANS
jgi:hypothetical protein